jgi:fumarate hydratase, class II
MTDPAPGSAETRTEHDTMGPVEVPAAALWGAQTQRAVDNLPFASGPLPAEVVHALGLVKAAAARANTALGVLEPDVGAAVASAADEVAAGHHDGQFPVDVFQTGSGTSTNMNANEVVAHLASARLGRPVHPNDHVNASQSSNDVFPTAIHVAAAVSVTRGLLPALWHLHAALERLAEENAATVKSGRTHLMDAAPVTFGQELRGYAAQVTRGVDRLQSALTRVVELPLGGTAVGTGLNAPTGFADSAVGWLADSTGLPFDRAADPFEAQSARDAIVELSAQLRGVALSLLKVCNDLRWLGSGPHTGLAEIRLPELQPGSSIMPGKVNPVVPEAVAQACMQVVGNDTAVAFAATASTFELNTAMPVMARNVCESVRLLTVGSRLLADRAVAGITVDAARMRRYAESSPAVAASLNRFLGYDTASRVVHHAERAGCSLREAVVALGLVADGRITEEQLDDALDVDRLARGG